MKIQTKPLFAFISGLFIIGLIACSNDDDSPDNKSVADPDEGQTYSENISASEGGVLESESGNVKLEVSGSALSSDTELTMEILPSKAGTLTSVYDFGPDGTVFSIPATLSIEYSGDSSDSVYIARWDGNDWEKLDTKSQGEMLIADVDHFTDFTVVGDKSTTPEPDGGKGPDNGSSGADSCSAYMADSCMADVIGDCWNPSGECTVNTDMTTGDTSIEWENGNIISVTVESFDMSAPIVAEARNASGTLCFTEETVTSLDSTVTTLKAPDGKEVTITVGMDVDDNMEVECPDGSTETYSYDEFNNMDDCLGADQEACTVNMEGMGDIVGSCETDADCEGGSCCDFGSGIKMCMPDAAGGCPEV